MAIDKCLPGLERKGEIDVGRSKEARDLYDELKRFYSRTHDEPTAAALASQKTIERLEAAAAHKKANAIREITARQDALKKMRTYDGGDPAGTGPVDPRGAMALFSFDEKAGHSDTVEARWKAVKGQAHAMVADVLNTFRHNLLGNIRNKAEASDLVREIYKPGSTGNANARELADAFTKASEWLRARFNEAGGAIGRIEGWFPQSHNARLIREAGYQTWRDFISPLLDRGKIVDRRTGEPFTDQALEPFLLDVWNTLRTDGWSKITEGAAGGKMLANQHADHRVLHFTDGDAWLAYHERFGQGNPFEAMVSHIEGMSRDIALMEILGPNPASFMRWIGDAIKKSAELDTSPSSKAIAHADKFIPKVQRLYDEVTGALRRPESEAIALGFSTFRSVQTSAKLGAAVLSALPTDPAFGAITRAFNGIPMWRMAVSYAKQLNPLTDTSRMAAVRSGLIAEEWAHMMSASYRYLNEEMTGEVARRLSQFTLRASGLSWFTQAGRWAFGQDILGHLTAESHKTFAELDGPLQRAFQRHGITPDHWDIIRKSPLEVHHGTGWIHPPNVAREDPRPGAAADKLLQFIHTEVNYAVPTADLETRALINGNLPRGTWTGEILRSGFLFKSFGISVILMHGRRMLERNLPGKIGYAAALFGLSMLGGAIALELKELAKGKDARPFPKDPGDRAKFLGASAAQGGGFGIFGDFFYSGTNRFGNGFAGTLVGPQAGTAQNIFNLGYDSAAKGIFGSKTANPGRQLITLMKQETPGSSLWFSRLAFEREVADQLQSEIDPKYRQSWRAMKQRARKQGQDFYWEPGATAPERAPRLGGG
jgi:hypothetical protein